MKKFLACLPKAVGIDIKVWVLSYRSYSAKFWQVKLDFCNVDYNYCMIAMLL